MNFNEEIAAELKEMGLGGQLYKLKEQEKGKPEDWMLLEKKISERVKENENMMEKSILYAKNSVII